MSSYEGRPIAQSKFGGVCAISAARAGGLGLRAWFAQDNFGSAARIPLVGLGDPTWPLPRAKSDGQPHQDVRLTPQAFAATVEAALSRPASTLASPAGSCMRRQQWRLLRWRLLAGVQSSSGSSVAQSLVLGDDAFRGARVLPTRFLHHPRGACHAAYALSSR